MRAYRLMSEEVLRAKFWRKTDRVLVVEDDSDIASLVATYLQREGFGVVIAHDGQAALQLAAQHRPVLIVLDIMLPDLDGWEVCRQLRRRSDVPVLMLTARGEEIDRVVGFSLGADDYVVKPFSPRELVERVKAILRRTSLAARSEQAPVVFGRLALDPDKHKVTLAGQPVSLTPSEYRLLQALMGSPGRVFSRDELLNRLHLEGEAVIDRVVDVHISKLRQKIEADPSRPQYILTVRGVGYALAEGPPECAGHS
jgi:DNA-binding response OmpR family regulator